MNKIEAKARDVIRYVREATTAGTPEHEIERRVIDVLWGVFHNMGYVEPDEAAQEAEREAHEEAVLYHFGEGRLEAEDVDKSGNVIYPLCLKACPMGYTEAQIREGLCTETCESIQEDEEDEGE